MPTAEEQLKRANRRLAEIAALEQTVQTLRDELAQYRSTLSRKLSMLQAVEAAGPAAEIPTTIAQDIISDLEASAEQVHEPVDQYEPELAAVDLLEEAVMEEVRETVAAVASAAEPEVYEDEEEGDERRTASRRQGNPIQLRITRMDTGDLLEGWVVDRSSGGVRLLLDQVLPTKALLSIRPVKAHSNFPWIKAEVRSCRPERGGYSIGCMFLQKLTWGELQAFG